MLVLTRKTSESIIINENIEITLLEIDGEQVKIGIKAPREIEVYRKELFEKTKNENQMAAEIPMELLKSFIKKD